MSNHQTNYDVLAQSLHKPAEVDPLKIITISKNAFNPISLPGMGRSIEVTELSDTEIMDIRSAYLQNELYIEFTEEPGTQLPVLQLWTNPHSPQITLFV